MGHTPEGEENKVRDRFHEVHNLRREHINSMDRYLEAMGEWMGERYLGTGRTNGRQLRFINKMANQDGIKGHIITTETYISSRNRTRTRYRDRVTGHFVSRTGQEGKKQAPGKLSDAEKDRRASLRSAQKQAKTRKYSEKGGD
jgi:hypothetical protein